MINEQCCITKIILRQIRSIRHCVPRQPGASFTGRVTGLVAGWDYGNATLVGVPTYAISRLQSALNAAARLVFSLQKYDSVTLLLQELHWWSSGLSTSSLFSSTAVSMALRHRTSPTTSGVSPTLVRGGACTRRQHPLLSFLHRGCPLSATVPFPWPRRECGTVCQTSSRRQRRCPCSSDT